MHVMVATDGSLDAAQTAVLAARLAGEDGRVTVCTVVEVPRQLLNEFRAAAGAFDSIWPTSMSTWHIVKPRRRCACGELGRRRRVRGELRQPGRCDTDERIGCRWKPSAPTSPLSGSRAKTRSRSVLEAVNEHAPDVLCVGTHGAGLFEGLLGSMSTKLARLAPCSVMLIR